MKGYSGFKFGDAKQSYPFSGGGSTFSAATSPSYLSGFSGLASPEEWRTQGTAFIQNPQMLQNRANLELAGRQYQFETKAMGDPLAAGERAYTFGREEDELGRLRMASEGQRLQSQMAFQPQMDTLGYSMISQMAFQPQMDTLGYSMMGRMGQRFGASMPKRQTPYSVATGFNPSWMRSYQTPKFPTI